MKLRTRIAAALSSAWDRAVHPENIYSHVYHKHVSTPVNEHRYVEAGRSQDGAKLYTKQQLVLPYENRLWAVASPAKGEKDKYVVHSFEQDLNTGTYEYNLSEKIRSRSVSFQSGRSLFTRDEAIDAIGQIETAWREKGYYQTNRQPPAEKLAVNLSRSGPAPSA